MPGSEALFIYLFFNFFLHSCPFSTSKQLVSSCQFKLADQPFTLLFSDSGESPGCLHQSQRPHTSKHVHRSALFVQQCLQIQPDPNTQTETQTQECSGNGFFITKWLERMKLQQFVYLYRHCPFLFLSKVSVQINTPSSFTLAQGTCRQ